MDYSDEQLSASIHDLDHAPPLPASPRPRTRTMSPLPSQSQARQRWMSADDAHFTRKKPLSGSPPTNLFSFALEKRTIQEFVGDLKLPPPEVSDNSGDHTRASAAVESVALSSVGASHVEPENVSSSHEEPMVDLGYSISSSLQQDEEWDETERTNGDRDALEASTNTLSDSNTRPPLIICGKSMPRCCSRLPTINEIAVFVAKHAPCFCYIGYKQPTDRATLGRLNALMALCSLYQIAAAICLAVVLYSPWLLGRTIPPQIGSPPENNHSYSSRAAWFSALLWTPNGAVMLLGMFGFLIFASSTFTWRVIRDVDLVGAIRFLWLLVWIVPCQFFAVISVFDHFDVTQVWLEHFWREGNVAWFRYRTCFPQDTYRQECTVPLSSIVNETAWCLVNYNATDCVAIRNSAQSIVEARLDVFYTFTGTWGAILLALMMLAINTLERIISKPLVQKARESNISAWLLLPTGCCIAFGCFLAFADWSVVNIETNPRLRWIGPLYILAGGLFGSGAALSWYMFNMSILSTNDKRKALLAAYLFIATLMAVLLALLCLFGVGVSHSLAVAYDHTNDAVRGAVACGIDYTGSCSRCDARVNRCPEWNSEDIVRILQQQAKASATMAAVFIFYSFGAIRFGFVMQRRISLYQIAYV